MTPLAKDHQARLVEIDDFLISSDCWRFQDQPDVEAPRTDAGPYLRTYGARHLITRGRTSRAERREHRRQHVRADRLVRADGDGHLRFGDRCCHVS